MKVAIYSIQSTLFEGEAEKLICWTPQGQITVLAHHLPIISSLTGPNIELVDRENKRSSISIQSGFLEVRPESEVVILAHEA
jgi:F-type H+-transporting ATPase subunit epsilon